jgi:oligopeptide/dipeptide ABC transporter ATP-binding protein
VNGGRGVDRAARNSPVLMRLEGVKVHFPVRGGIFGRPAGFVQAVDGVDLEIMAGETLGLVGESGCGKSTLGRAMLRLVPVRSGRIIFRGQDITALSQRQMRPLRKELQMIFQDPYSSLDPRKTALQIVSEPLDNFGEALPNGHGKRSRRAVVEELLQTVGLRPESADRYPHEFSGGQRQRIGIARAIALHPRLIVADEPVSALDVSIQAQVLNLLRTLQREFGLTYVFIAHDLSVVRHITDRVAVMYLGRLVELAASDELYHAPQHPYTQALLSAIPIPDPEVERRRTRIILTGDVPSPVNPPRGCRFHTRCFRAQAVCAQVDPPFEEKAPGHWAACHFPGPA